MHAIRFRTNGGITAGMPAIVLSYISERTPPCGNDDSLTLLFTITHPTLDECSNKQTPAR